MKKEISRISVHQTSKVFALLYFLYGLIVLIFTLIAGALSKGSPLMTNTDGSSISFDSIGFFLFLMPFFLLLIGYLSTLLISFFYNIVAKYFGGIEFDLNDSE